MGGLEVIALSGFIIAILGALATAINKIGLKRCHTCCIDSDCRKNSDDILEKKINKLEETIERSKIKIDKIKSKQSISEPSSPNYDVIETIL